MSQTSPRLTLAVLAVSGLIALAATARTAPADAPDWPVAFDADVNGDLYVAMDTDVLDQGGLARMAPDCVAVNTWRTAPVIDLAVARAELVDIWTLEEWPAGAYTDRRVRRYDGTGAASDGFPVPATARYIEHVDVYPSAEIYLAHEAAGGGSGRVGVHGPTGGQLRGWSLPGTALGLAVGTGGGSDRPVYVLTGSATPPGLLLRYSMAGAVVWEKPLDFAPVALSVWGDQAYVIGAGAGGAAQVVQYRGDATIIRSWPVAGFTPTDLVVAGGTSIWVLGHPPGERLPSTLRRYNYDGTLLSTCDRFPQPSQPTPAGTAACPAPTPGAEAWRYAASGPVAAGPAVAADGTTYWATQKGLLYALDCAGRRKWLFDYRVESGGSWGAQAFEGAPAVDEAGTIYIGDDIVVPNFFFAIRPDGTTKWVQHYESLYSQIDTSPALAADGHIFAAANGWGAGVDHGAILVLHRDGRLLRPAGAAWSEDGVGPITDSPVVLADGSAAYLSPPFAEWVLPTGTPPTVTPVPPRPTRTATSGPTGPTATPSTSPGTPTAAVTGTATHPTPTDTPFETASPPPTGTLAASATAIAPPGYVAYLPHLLTGSAPPATGGVSRPAAAPDQPMPPPYVTLPVPARLRLVRADGAPDIVLDLPGLADPSSPATDGRGIWFTAAANDGAHLLAYRAGEPPVLWLDWNLDAGAAAAPALGQLDPVTGEMEVLLMGTDGRLVALDTLAERGLARLRWARFIGLPATGAPALGDDGRVYVAAGQVVQALDRATGEVAWSLALDSTVSGSVNLAPGGMLYVATASGEVLAIGTGATGLDPAAAWPAFRRDARNTGARDGGG